MSARQKSRYEKLLSMWVPPDDAGKPIACITTSYTFSASFFEEQCLSRFLAMDSDPVADGVDYLIEREEKMSGLVRAIVLADSQHCTETRSLRWDVIPARVHGGVQHAKVSLLIWQNYIRVIFTSANMTEDGYYKNQEVFTSLDYFAGSTFPKQALIDTLHFLESMSQHISVEKNSITIKRWDMVIQKAREIGTEWGETKTDSTLSILPIFILPDSDNIFDQFKKLWGNRGGVTDAYVVSPFFDADEFIAEKTVKELVLLLNARNTEKTVSWHTTAVKSPDAGYWHMNLPVACEKVPSRKHVNSYFHRISEKVTDDEEEHYRPLHAKSLWFANDRWAGYICGSSNFTQRGTGLSKNPNIEANILYLFKEDLRSAYKLFNRAWLEGVRVESAQLGFGELGIDDGEEENKQNILPLSFGAAFLRQSDNGDLFLELCISNPPDRWKIIFGETQKTIGTDKLWEQEGRPAKWHVPWTVKGYPSLLQVYWDDDQSAYWIVNIADLSILPPPEELQDLSIDALIEILSSQGSLRDVMRRILRRKAKLQESEKNKLPDELDPHKRIDTSRYLIPRTRRISRALVGLRSRLERPVATEEALKWRLYGPIGVRAVIKALRKHAEGNNDEFAFLMVELALDIARISYSESRNTLSTEIFYGYIRKMLKEIVPDVKHASSGASSMIKSYCSDALKEINTIIREGH